MEAIYKKLLNSLQDLISYYGDLFDLLQNERLILIASDVEKLNESNKNKEAVLLKIRQSDKERSLYAQELAKNIGLAAENPTGNPTGNPRLLAIAEKMSSIHKAEAEMLRNIHSSLSLQIQKVVDLNQENENYTKTALRVLNGAIEDIKEAAVGTKKKNYGKQGKKENASIQQSGNFVSKEA